MVSAMLNNMPNLNTKYATFISDALPQACSFTHVSLKTSKDASSTRQVANASTLAPRVSTKVAEKCSRSLPRLWRKIQGSNNWKNLVEPLDPLLRKEIIRYGELVTACYKAFDVDPNSKRYLNCKYGKTNMLREVGLGNSGYEITKYIYATPDINIPIQNGACHGRWIGYVAVSDDAAVKRLGRRDIVVTFRGTVTNNEWIANLMSSLTPARLDPHNPRPEVKVEAGFLSLYTSNESDCKFGLESCRDQLLSEVSRLLNKHKGEEISITLAGHSMGSSLALLFAYDLAELELNRRDDHSDNEIPVAVFSFGGPRVGNSGFKERCEELGVKVLRIVNVNDPITKLPGVVFNENFKVQFGVLGEKYEFPWRCSCYAHVGEELLLDFFKMHDPSCVHDMGTYVSLLKCPKTTSQVVRKEDADFLNKAKDFVITAAKNLDSLPWKDAALNMVNLVQSQRA